MAERVCDREGNGQPAPPRWWISAALDVLHADRSLYPAYPLLTTPAIPSAMAAATGCRRRSRAARRGAGRGDVEGINDGDPGSTMAARAFLDTDSRYGTAAAMGSMLGRSRVGGDVEDDVGWWGRAAARCRCKSPT